MSKGERQILDRALVLRRGDYAESSQVARLFTREHGLLPVLAKGIRRANMASFRGPLDLFQRWTVRLVPPRGRGEMWLLVGAEDHAGLRGLRRRLERFEAASALAEIWLKGHPPEAAAPLAFDALDGAFEGLAAAGSQGIARLSAWAKVRYLDGAGVWPEFHRCLECGREAPERGPVRFAPELGGLSCRPCLAGRPRRTYSLRLRERTSLDALHAGREAPVLPIAGLDPESLPILRPLFDEILTLSLETELRASGVDRLRR